jgi:hypothetical protein
LVGDEVARKSARYEAVAHRCECTARLRAWIAEAGTASGKRAATPPKRLSTVEVCPPAAARSSAFVSPLWVAVCKAVTISITGVC